MRVSIHKIFKICTVVKVFSCLMYKQYSWHNLIPLCPLKPDRTMAERFDQLFDTLIKIMYYTCMLTIEFVFCSKARYIDIRYIIKEYIIIKNI